MQCGLIFAIAIGYTSVIFLKNNDKTSTISIINEKQLRRFQHVQQMKQQRVCRRRAVAVRTRWGPTASIACLAAAGPRGWERAELSSISRSP